MTLPRSEPKTPETRYPPTGPILHVDGFAVHAHVAGDGPDLILIHGASGNTRDFTFDLIDRLTGDFRVIAFDRPGLGHSDPLHTRGETPFEQAEILDKAAEMLGVERAVVLGHSYGGAVAMAWALNHPERVGAVVSLAGAVAPWPGGLGPWYTIASSRIGGAVLPPLISRFLPESIKINAVTAIFEPNDVPDGYADHVGVDLTLRPHTIRANARQVNGLKPHVIEMKPRYQSLDIPIEILHGDADTIVPAHIHSEVLDRLAPNACLTMLPDVGHMPHHVAPQATVDAILRAAARAGLRPADPAS